MKKLILLLLLSFFLTSCSSHSSGYDNPAGWKHFNIYAKTDDDEIFLQLQQDLGIYPLLESYLVTVDLRNPQYRFIIIGGENNYGSATFSWDKLSKTVQDGLIKWKESNKEKL